MAQTPDQNPPQEARGAEPVVRGPASHYLEIQRLALQEVLNLSADSVAPTEAEIEQEYQRARQAAEKELAESAAKADARLQEKLAATERARAEHGGRAESEYAAADAVLEKNAQATQENAAAEREEAQREARRLRDDRLLMNETVARAALRGLREKSQSLQGERARRQKQLESLHARGRQVAQEHACGPPEGPVASAPADANAADDDPAATYKAQSQSAAAHVAALETLATPGLLVGAGPLLGLVLLNVTAVGVPALLYLLEIAPAQPLLFSGLAALAVTITVTVLVSRALRRKARAVLRTRIRDEYGLLQGALAAAGRALEQQFERVSEQLRREEAQAVEKRDQETRAARDDFDDAVADAEFRHTDTLQKAEAARTAAHDENVGRRDSSLRQAAEEKERRQRRYRERHDQALAAARQEYERATADCRNRRDAARAALETRWTEGLAHIRRLLDETDRLNRLPRVDWSSATLPDWTPADEFTALIRFGHWRLDLDRLAASVRRQADFLADRPATVLMPALLALPTRSSLLLQTERAGRQEALDTLRAVMLRLLTSLPPGRVRFTIIDPVGLGENFAGFMHLVDYEEGLVGGRIWTESEHIEARLTELTSHMENVIQKYLRNEFETIDAYNQQAGELAEPYRFLVIADFPANFNEEALRRLTSIVSSGARCGLFTLIAHDRRLPTPHELQIEDVAAASVHLVHEGDRFVLQDDLLRQWPLTLDAPPSEEVLTRIVHAVGQAAKDALRVEVPFELIAPAPAQCWAAEARTEVNVPLGHTGAVRLQHLRLGRGLAQHALIAGKTGSGKSNLLHVIITNVALRYSPDEVEFYLVDFKKGVEFKVYVTHPLPHARAIAIESDREFGVSVLQRIDAELARRGDLFRAAGVQDLAAYRETTGAVLPRTLLIVDEFQVFFTEDDRLAQDAGVLLDRLVRQGRAFGIHVMLGSQTLGGSTGLARSTMGQMAVRIALQCSEADSQLILDDTNVAARLLSRPGEAIYNDAGGLVEGNSPFQIAWLPDARRNTYLDQVSALAAARQVRREPPVVFEGNAPSDIRQNRMLAALLEAPAWPAASGVPQAWLGEAVAIKDPTAVPLRRQSGANLLLVGQRDDAALAMMAAALVALGAQLPPARARFVILDARPAEAQEAGELRDVGAVLPHETRFVPWRDVAGAIAELAAEAQRRVAADETDAPAIFLFVYGVQRYRMLRRQEDEFSFAASGEDKPPAADKQFAELLREGPHFGIHVVAWSDTLATLERTLDRQAIGEFDHRVLFQMSAADSSHLIDTPEANKLGFYRALLYSEEHGLLEKFRPYAAPDADWRAHAQQCLGRKRAPADRAK